MTGKKHTMAEISAKMTQAGEMAAKGKKLPEICRTIGVSTMTFYRWKKQARAAEKCVFGEAGPDSEPTTVDFRDNDSGRGIRRLEIENFELRQILADILLKKHRLEREVRALNEGTSLRGKDPSR